MTLEDFEALYRDDPDPWSYETSAYEREKYDATLDACGGGRFRCALELGSSIGVLSVRLAPRCERLVCIDGAPTAVGIARRRIAGTEGVELVLGQLPQAIPDGRYDLVVASEILYYLDEAALTATLARLREVMAAQARLVAVHWRPSGAERPFSAQEVHARLRAASWLTAEQRSTTGDYLLDILRRS